MIQYSNKEIKELPVGSILFMDHCGYSNKATLYKGKIKITRNDSKKLEIYMLDYSRHPKDRFYVFNWNNNEIQLAGAHTHTKFYRVSKYEMIVND